LFEAVHISNFTYKIGDSMYIGHKVVDYQTCMGLSNYGAANMLLKLGQIRVAYAGLMQLHIIKTL
jgi:hypothetical protein